MTDPRFYGWLWSIENEVRKNVPMVYYHVWDNFPLPKFNKLFYESTDVVCTISKVTDEIVKKVSPSVESIRIPHAVDTEIFKKETKQGEVAKFRDHICGGKDKMIFFWNNRNARRKQSGSLIYWFKEFLDRIGHDKACLLMHTDPKDPNGQDLEAIVESLELVGHNQVQFSTDKLPPEHLSKLYTSSDCTINIADAEGFGLATLESLACETPIIVNMTGGLQEQVTDGKNWFGFGINPSSKAVIGSQSVPYIYEDRINGDEFVQKLVDFYNLEKEERLLMGSRGREHVLKNFSFDEFNKLWKNTLDYVYEKYGSWENRKHYKKWNFEEIT